MTAAILPSHNHLFCCFNFQVKVSWILIGCQCYYRYNLENCSESNSNNINLLCHYVVDFAILIELEQFIKMYSYCYSYCPCEQAFIQRFILHGVGRPHDCHHFAITWPPVQSSYMFPFIYFYAHFGIAHKKTLDVNAKMCINSKNAHKKKC